MTTLIVTKYFGPTDTRGSRIKAYLGKTTKTIPYPYELSGEECHMAAVAALCVKLDIPIEIPDDKWISHYTDKGYIFIRNT
jgi:hypothetical protein